MQEEPFIQEGEFSDEGGFGKKRGRWGKLDEPLHNYFCTQCLSGRDSYAKIASERTVGRVFRK
jgi:hypothetical protein